VAGCGTFALDHYGRRRLHLDYQTKLRRLAVDTLLARADEVIE